MVFVLFDTVTAIYALVDGNLEFTMARSDRSSVRPVCFVHCSVVWCGVAWF